MARARGAANSRSLADTVLEAQLDAIQWYRGRLVDEPASVPWDPETFEPALVGPSWLRRDDGHWDLPEHTLGWEALGWCAANLIDPDGDIGPNGEFAPWSFTLEQARFILWWYAIDERGRFRWDRGVIQRLKGAGKSPMILSLAMFETLGRCRFGGWDSCGDPIAVRPRTATVKIAALDKDQAKSTLSLAVTMLAPWTVSRHRVVVGKELIWAEGDTRSCGVISNMARSQEGRRPTAFFVEEPHHFLDSNGGHALNAVIERNLMKVRGGQARALAGTNAYEDGEDSVAERDRIAWEDQGWDGNLLYDSLEAPESIKEADVDRFVEVITAIRGDATWLDLERQLSYATSKTREPGEVARYVLNQVGGAAARWLDPADVRDAGADLAVRRSEPVVAFLDCSKSRDSTALAVVRVSDDYGWLEELWVPTGGPRPEDWVDRSDVDATVTDLVSRHNVVGLWADPSDAMDATGESYWDDLLDDWHKRWSNKLQLWGKPGKRDGHAIRWDMRSPQNIQRFTEAAGRTRAAFERAQVKIGDDPRLRRHLNNARVRYNKHGTSIGKEDPKSRRKIDAAVALVVAREMARMHRLNPPRSRTGLAV